MASVAVPVVPLLFALRVRCDDDGHSFGLRIIPLGIGLLAVVAWLAMVYRLDLSSGTDPAAADRFLRHTAAFLLPAMVAELLASGITMEASCTGQTNHPRIVHLGIAGTMLVIGIVWGALRQRLEPTSRNASSGAP